VLFEVPPFTIPINYAEPYESLVLSFFLLSAIWFWFWFYIIPPITAPPLAFLVLVRPLCVTTLVPVDFFCELLIKCCIS
jgi:hypothetical protein